MSSLGMVRHGAVRQGHILGGKNKMKKIEVEIQGTSPLLMHSAHSMEEQAMKKKPSKTIRQKERCGKRSLS